MEVYAPLSGTLHPLSQIPDRVFAEKMLGDGVALMPIDDNIQVVSAPASGRIDALFPHAFVISGILVHIGVNSATCPAFTALASKGQRVSVGQPIVEWNVAVSQQLNIPSWVAVVAVESHHISLVAAYGSQVEAQSLIFSCTTHTS